MRKPRLSTRPSVHFSFHEPILSLLVRLSVAWHQRLQRWLDFHEIPYKSSLQKHGATVSHTPLKDVNESLPALSIFIRRFFSGSVRYRKCPCTATEQLFRANRHNLSHCLFKGINTILHFCSILYSNYK
jgi:hypothetical protein